MGSSHGPERARSSQVHLAGHSVDFAAVLKGEREREREEASH